MSHLRACVASATLLFSLPALAGCGAVQQVQNGFQAGFHKGFRSNFKSSFLRSCERGDDNRKPFCECAESAVERNSTDEQLMAMKPTDKKFADALHACRSKI